jgi:cyclopropane-fatty-acyl-phospholipid synthase
MKIDTNLANELSEKGWLPDAVIRTGIRALLERRLAGIHAADAEALSERKQSFTAAMDKAGIAPLPHKANEQHYEVPAGFFRHVLGARMKYSCGYWDADTTTLDASEERALMLTCEHAELGDGMSILELGCGWGSLTLWMAQHYPDSRITAVSNSASQRAMILERAERMGLTNIEVITADMNDFDTEAQFDRVVSVEMFEHMRNYRELYARVARWLKPGGKFFKHIFVHRDAPYLFEDRGPGDWMSRFFFSGGMMPSDDLPLFFQDALRIERLWRWDGRHYEKTANAWLTQMDMQKERLWPLFEATYGKDFAATWWQRWRIFFMACAELFGYDKGQQWWVSHYLFQKPRD